MVCSYSNALRIYETLSILLLMGFDLYKKKSMTFYYKLTGMVIYMFPLFWFS